MKRRNIIILSIIIPVLILIGITVVCVLIDNNEEDKNIEENISSNTEGNEEIVLENRKVELENGEEYPKTIKEMLDIPLPEKVIYYHDGKPSTFGFDTYEYKKIISLMNARDNGKISATKEKVNTSYEIDKAKRDIIEYYYRQDGSIFFNNIDEKNETVDDNTKDYNYIYVDYNKNIFNNLEYKGIEYSKELAQYLSSLI